ncbi:acyl carrier protein [Methylobacterium sp. P31]
MTIGYNDLISFMQNDLAIDTGSIGEKTPLFSSGLIDSFSLVSLMTYLEQEAKISILPTDVTLDNFDSIEKILSYLSSK